MWPWFLRIIAGRKCLTSNIGAIIFTSKTLWILDSGQARIDMALPIPALLMRTVGSPCSETICLETLEISLGLERSAEQKDTLGARTCQFSTEKS